MAWLAHSCSHPPFPLQSSDMEMRCCSAGYKGKTAGTGGWKSPRFPDERDLAVRNGSCFLLTALNKAASLSNHIATMKSQAWSGGTGGGMERRKSPRI